MSGRRSLAVGELGSVTFEKVKNGFRARGRTKDASGKLRRPSFVASTKQEAEDGLRIAVAKLVYATQALDDQSAVRVFLQEWVEESKDRIKPQSVRVYAETANWLEEMIGAIPISQLDTFRVRKILLEVERARSKSAARYARIALNGAFFIAIERRAIRDNPIAGLPRRPQHQAIPKALEPNQIHALREAIKRREERVRPRVGPTAAMVRLVVEIQLGCGLRIGEVLALRNRDVDFETGIIEVTGTLISDENGNVVRQDELKSRSQARKIKAPTFVIDAFREALSFQASPRIPLNPILQSRAGTWVTPSSLRRALRDVRNDKKLVAILAETGLSECDLTPHMLRRTAATLLALHTGSLAMSKELLGHSDEKITKVSYAGISYRTVGNAEILQEVLGT